MDVRFGRHAEEYIHSCEIKEVRTLPSLLVLFLLVVCLLLQAVPVAALWFILLLLWTKAPAHARLRAVKEGQLLLVAVLLYQ